MFINFTQLGQPDGNTVSARSGRSGRPAPRPRQYPGQRFASFLIGVPNSGTMEHTFEFANASSYGGFYVQDD